MCIHNFSWSPVMRSRRSRFSNKTSDKITSLIPKRLGLNNKWKKDRTHISRHGFVLKNSASQSQQLWQQQDAVQHLSCSRRDCRPEWKNVISVRKFFSDTGAVCRSQFKNLRKLYLKPWINYPGRLGFGGNGTQSMKTDQKILLEYYSKFTE